MAQEGAEMSRGDIGTVISHFLSDHHVPEGPSLRRRKPQEGVGGAYTEDEILSVVQYATARHIEVMPEVDVPGHTAAAISAYPELGNGGFGSLQQPPGKWGVHD